MNNLSFYEATATTKWQDNERKIAAAERRRQENVALQAARASEEADHTFTARLPRVSAIGAMTNMRRAFGRGLANVVVRRQPA